MQTLKFPLNQKFDPLDTDKYVKVSGPILIFGKSRSLIFVTNFALTLSKSILGYKRILRSQFDDLKYFELSNHFENSDVGPRRQVVLINKTLVYNFEFIYICLKIL